MNPQVVGASPVGLTMAVELARYRVPVRVVDKAAHGSDKSKALVLWTRTLELFDRAAAAEAFVAAGHKVVGANIVAGAKVIGHIGLESIDSAYPCNILFGVAPLRQAMADRLSEVSIGYAHSPLNGAAAHHLGGPRRRESACRPLVRSCRSRWGRAMRRASRCLRQRTMR